MDIRLDISGSKDIDLFALKDEETFNLENAILKALKSYVEGKKIEISVPFITQYDNRDFSRCSVHIYVSEKKEPELCSFVESIPDGFRSIVIKSIFRNFLSVPAISFLTHNKIVSAVPSVNTIIAETSLSETKKKGFALKDNRKNIQKKEKEPEKVIPIESTPVVSSETKTDVNIQKEGNEQKEQYKEQYNEDMSSVSDVQEESSDDAGMDFGMFGFVENY